jgi:hypothetical protein
VAIITILQAAERRKIRHINFPVEIEQEEDDRWIAEVVDLPGVLVDGSTSEEAGQGFKLLRFSSWHGEAGTDFVSISFAAGQRQRLTKSPETSSTSTARHQPGN